MWKKQINFLQITKEHSSNIKVILCDSYMENKMNFGFADKQVARDACDIFLILLRTTLLT